MPLRVVGAGVSRIGTTSLTLALERLLGAPCYHMNDVFDDAEHVATWHEAAKGHMPDWLQFLGPYGAAVGWPSAAFWPELSHAFPDAIVLLSLRDPVSWWRSVHDTIFPAAQGAAGSDWHAMFDAVLSARFTSHLESREACIAAFERHNALVRDTVAPHRLVEWHLGDGWAPLCAALKLPVPVDAFPHANTREEFLAGHSREID